MKAVVTGVLLGCALGLGGCTTMATAGPRGAAPMAFDHFMTAISVADLEKETAWFRDNLGFTVTADTKIGGGTPIRWLENGNERIELILAAGSTAGPARAAPPRHAGVRGLSQVTLQTDNLQAVRDALVAKGITPALDITDVAPLGIKVIYLLDPEGNAIEIAQRTGAPTK
jgi:catechol 2,3-dioxygenase-like lactoylglutathione lyase family enzyme